MGLPPERSKKRFLQTRRVDCRRRWKLRTVREGRERRRYQGDPFQKAIDWIAQSEQQGETVIIYKYRGIPGQFRNDGTLEPADRTLAIAGRDFLVQPMVRRLSDPLFEEDLQGVEGRVFFVKLRQLVFEGRGLRVSEEPGSITDPNVPGQDFAQSPETYPEAVIAFEAEYYSLPTTTFAYLSGAFDPNNFTRPIFSRNLVVRR